MDPDQTTPTQTPTTDIPQRDLASDPEYQKADKLVDDFVNQDPDNPTISLREAMGAYRTIAVLTKGAPHTVLHGDYAITVDPLTNKVIKTEQIPGGAASKTQAERDAYVAQQNASALASNASARHSDAEIAAMDTPDQKTARETSLENLRQSGENLRNQATIQGTHENVTAQETGANQRNTATEAGATARNQATIQGTHENVTAQEAGATHRTELTGQNALAQIEANRQAAIEAARQKFDQDKDLAAFTSELARVNSTALETLKGEQARQTQSQAAELEKPYKQATAAAETSNAATNQRRAEQEAAYQNASLDQTARVNAAKPLTDLSQRNGDMLSKMAESGTAPVAGAGALVFSPLEMAFSLMRQGVRDGTIDANHVPDYGAPSPTSASGGIEGGQPSGLSSSDYASQYSAAPAPQGPVQSLGSMTPEAEPGYQYPQAAPAPAPAPADDSAAEDDNPDIPHLARGGIVNRPTVALVGERGPEAVVPLTQEQRPTGILQESAASGSAQYGRRRADLDQGVGSTWPSVRRDNEETGLAGIVNNMPVPPPSGPTGSSYSWNDATGNWDRTDKPEDEDEEGG